MKKQLFLICFLFVELSAQDLKTTIEEMIRTNPTILEREKNYKASNEDIDTAFAGYYPKLNLSLGAGFEKTHKNTIVGGENTLDFSVYQNSLKYTQNIFEGFNTHYTVKSQEFKTAAAAYSYVEKVNTTSLDMVNRYLELMKNQELLVTAKRNVSIDEEILSKVQKLYDAGLTTLSEVNKIESSLALAESNLVVQENTLLDASYNLQYVLGRKLDPKKMQRPVVTTLLPKSRKEAEKFALEHNPSLIVSAYNVQLAQATKDEKYSVFYPKIDIEVSESLNKNLSGIEGQDDRFRAMAYVSYNFFNGFADTSALQKSKYSLYQEHEKKNTLKRQVIQNLNLSWSAYKKLQEQLTHLVEYKTFSKKTLELYSKEYDLGRRSLLDLLSAQNDYIKSDAQIISTEYSVLYAEYRIMDALGILVPEILQEGVDKVYDNVSLSVKNVRGEK